jgi:hypothetical protein
MQVTCPKAISCARPAAPSSRPNILTLTQPRTRVVEVVYDNNRKVMIHTAALWSYGSNKAKRAMFGFEEWLFRDNIDRVSGR